MFFHMKTTLILPDNLVRDLKRRAADRAITLSEVVAEALRLGLEKQPVSEMQPMPVYRMGAAKVDVSDREALYQAMEGS